uniref:Uncharacterized protein n=1 Tax=Rhodnius prolixus TaxID=13249 RepID=T1HYM3_RHOPR
MRTIDNVACARGGGGRVEERSVSVERIVDAAKQVDLTVHQNPLRERSCSNVIMSSPSLQARHAMHHHAQHQTRDRDRITGPQPVDFEKLRQFEHQRANTLKLMLEKEQTYVDSLRSKLAKCSDTSVESKITQDLLGAERRVNQLQMELEQEERFLRIVFCGLAEAILRECCIFKNDILSLYIA